MASLQGVDVLDACGMEENGAGSSRREWLLLTDKRSKLREVFALETLMVKTIFCRNTRM